MLKFKRIEVNNFVVLDDLVLEPSTDPDKPLTVIRAENGSGKTTVLRALRWGMYGERGLPGHNPADWSLHPIDWAPTDEPVTTEVIIEFDTDGSTRYDGEPGDSTTRYRLKRAVRTVGIANAKPGERDFRREAEDQQLMVKEIGRAHV